MRISDWSSDVCSSDLPPLAAVRLPQSLNRKEYQMIDIHAQLRRQIELEDEQRALGQSRYNSRKLPWKVEAGSIDEEANLPPGQKLLKVATLPTAKAVEEFLEEANSGKAGRRDRKSTRLNSSH